MKRVLGHTVRRRHGTRGQALVEFAIVMPIIVVVVLGLLDLGRAVYAYNTLAQSSRQAARTAIVNQVTADVKAQAIASGATLGLTSSDVDVCFKTAASTQNSCSSATNDCPAATRSIGCLAIVRTHISYAPMTPVVALLMSTINLSSTSIEAVEYVCPDDGAATCTS
jgi:Flp pilus assembly protein TadG